MTIQASKSTQFPVGSKVRILNSGHCYSGYAAMAKYMDLTIKIPCNPFITGEIGTVVAKAMHENGEREVLAVRVERGIGLIDVKGVVEHEEPKVVRFQDMKVGQTVKLVNAGEGHLHWKFELNKETVVGKREDGRVGPKDKDGDIPWCNFAGWEFVVVKDVPVVPAKPKLANYELVKLQVVNATLARLFKDAPDWATHIGSDSYGVHYFDHHPHVYNGRNGNVCSFLKGLLPDGYKHKAANQGGATQTLEAVEILRPKAQEPTKDEVIAKLKQELATVKAKLFTAQSKLNQIGILATE